MRINIDWKVDPFYAPKSLNQIGICIRLGAYDPDDAGLDGLYYRFHNVLFGEIEQSSMTNFLFYLGVRMQEDLIHHLRHKQTVKIGCYCG